MHYKLKVDALATGAAANTYATLLGLKLANTTGHRCRLRRLVIGGGGAAAEDIQVSLRLRRTGNTADGTSTAVNVNTIGDARGGSVASRVAAIGKNYTVEPTTYETGALGLGAMNSRATLIMEWGPDDAPVWGPNQTLGLEAAPGSAAAAHLEAALEWEEF
ncbi:MAG: hypothetical protein WC107_06235 [Patescibacteria group bacterium]